MPVDITNDQRRRRLDHADKHGFLAIPQEDEQGLLDAARFMDENECNTLIAEARSSTGQSIDEMLDAFDRGTVAFGKAAARKFGRGGEGR